MQAERCGVAKGAGGDGYCAGAQGWAHTGILGATSHSISFTWSKAAVQCERQDSKAEFTEYTQVIGSNLYI